jgi:hypothetical protein
MARFKDKVVLISGTGGRLGRGNLSGNEGSFDKEAITDFKVNWVGSRRGRGNH